MRASTEGTSSRWGRPIKSFALRQFNPSHPSLGLARKGEVWTAGIGRGFRALARSFPAARAPATRQHAPHGRLAFDFWEATER